MQKLNHLFILLVLMTSAFGTNIVGQETKLAKKLHKNMYVQKVELGTTHGGDDQFVVYVYNNTPEEAMKKIPSWWGKAPVVIHVLSQPVPPTGYEQ